MTDFIVKITSKGQITLPKEIRNSLNIKRGDYAIFHMFGNKIEFEKAQITGLSAFNKLSNEVEKQFLDNQIKLEDIDEARKWANG